MIPYKDPSTGTFVPTVAKVWIYSYATGGWTQTNWIPVGYTFGNSVTVTLPPGRYRVWMEYSWFTRYPISTTYSVYGNEWITSYAVAPYTTITSPYCDV